MSRQMGFRCLGRQHPQLHKHPVIARTIYNFLGDVVNDEDLLT
jgi:hypothetical protein